MITVLTVIRDHNQIRGEIQKQQRIDSKRK